MKMNHLFLPSLLALLMSLAFAGRAEQGSVTLSGPEMRRYLANVSLAEVKFERAEVKDAVKFLSTAGSEGKHAVNILLLDPDKERPRITLDLRGSTLLDTLQTVCQIAGLKMEYKRGILILKDR